MSSRDNPDITPDPTETGVRHGVYDGYLTTSGLAGTLRRMARRHHTTTPDDTPVHGPVCEHCGRGYHRTGSRQRFCTKRCYLADKQRQREAQS